MQDSTKASGHQSDTKIRRLNAEYVDAFLRSDVDWYDRHLAKEFRCILASGQLLERSEFLVDAQQAAKMKSFEIADVSVQFNGDTAVVQARTVHERLDGTRGQSRYTDIWIGRDNRWQVLCAQITSVASL